ncbi:2-hydroxycarboxylate transporter family protein [Zhihengliuella flava]|uniref:Na+/citrate or Na+/malate symporter n=1 Tax=Zhihengliuella flava TaxID=1285193 RepID=A0A931D6X7_9MICC|nr:Na+/citrate or Na+/malate symporter [Zhihengliuella flava]
MPAPIYLVLTAVVLIAAVTGNLPTSMVSGFTLTILLGGLFIWLGNLIPKVRDFGLPTILCTFGPATLIYFGLMPQPLIDVATIFVAEQGFLDFFIVAIIAGSLLGMPRQLLMKAGPRFAAPLLGCIAVTFLVVGALSALFGQGFIEGILFVAAPAMAGGLGLGALPMSEMYAAQTGTDSGAFMGDLMSVVVIANIFCILIAGIYNALSKARRQLFVGFNGYGQLMRVKGTAAELSLPEKRKASSFIALGQGLLIAGGLFVLGELLGAYLTFMHPYAWTIVAAALVKIFSLLPQELENSTADWGDMVNAVLVPALLVGVSISYISIEEVLASLTNPLFIVLTAASVVLATVSSGLIGWLLKFNFVEVSITPGLVMADTGGSGDVAVLSAADRLHLMPFAALSTRLGGAVVLFVTSFLVQFL